jgi:hypothetical protein
MMFNGFFLASGGVESQARTERSLRHRVNRPSRENAKRHPAHRGSTESLYRAQEEESSWRNKLDLVS